MIANLAYFPLKHSCFSLKHPEQPSKQFIIFLPADKKQNANNGFIINAGINVQENADLYYKSGLILQGTEI